LPLVVIAQSSQAIRPPTFPERFIIAAKSEAKKSRATEEAEAEHREDIAQRQIVLIEANTKLTEAIHGLTEEVHKHILETT
jgi:hypothetical protein